MRELVVFGAVGIVATIVHYLCAILAIELLGLAVLHANVLAYGVAVGISFWGHSLLTFRSPMTRERLLKFVVVSLSALVLSQFLLWLLTTGSALGHRVNMIAVVCLVPFYTYVLNRFWVFEK